MVCRPCRSKIPAKAGEDIAARFRASEVSLSSTLSGREDGRTSPDIVAFEPLVTDFGKLPARAEISDPP